MKSTILLLGAPNDEKGVLSQIAKDRIECAYNIYNHNTDIMILCTGGFGEHFNKAPNPHAYYAKQQLMKRGINEDAFLPFALSSNTYEDFMKALPIIKEENPDVLIVVTSDFHIERVKILYNRIIKKPNVIFIPAKSTLSEEELSHLCSHERQRVEELKA